MIDKTVFQSPSHSTVESKLDNWQKQNKRLWESSPPGILPVCSWTVSLSGLLWEDRIVNTWTCTELSVQTCVRDHLEPIGTSKGYLVCVFSYQDLLFIWRLCHGPPFDEIFASQTPKPCCIDVGSGLARIWQLGRPGIMWVGTHVRARGKTDWLMNELKCK